MENNSNDIWHQLRGENIGGSEVAALFGESSYLTYYELWNIKNGFLEPKNLDDVERVQAGNFMEAGAINWYNHVYKTKFYQPLVYIKHATVKGMACTPDALDAENDRIMAQVKNVDSLIFKNKWEAKDGQIIKAPLEILLQCQHEMECADKEENHLIVIVGGNRLFRLICKRDKEIGLLIKESVVKFWELKQPPEPDFERDGETILTLRNKLPLQEFEDLSDYKYLYELCRKALKETVKKKKIEDSLNAITAEVTHLISGFEKVRCKDMIIKLPKGKKTPTYISEREIF